ncbi:MAG: DUF2889 domain-containing protein [bacterium]|nr:DUF2889 domain-containing protein [bacterium]
MRLDLHGEPLHTRTLGVTLTQRADGHLDAAGVLLDLRKRGFVPVGGDLQPAGIVHQMLLDGVIDPAGPTLTQLAVRQPHVAFERSALTRGESCRDPADRIALLAGARLDAGWARRLAEDIGGPRGCSHVLTLAQYLGATIAWVLPHLAAPPGVPPWDAGRRVFRRDVAVDGAQPDERTLVLALQQIDLHLAPVSEPAPAMERFAGARELRVLATVDLGAMAFTALEVAERRRDAARLDAPWAPRTDVAERCRGLSVLRGVSAALLERVDAADDRPVLDALLQLAPTLIQVFAALSDPWAAMAREQGWIVGMGGRPDSCWMWRRGGALRDARGPGDPAF